MSRQKKTNRKTSTTASSSSSSSRCSLENDHWQTMEQPMRRLSQSSSKGSIYPNVPKRTRPLLSIDEDEIIETESRIDIIPSGIHSSRSQGSSNNRVENKRHGLDLLLKYTSPTKEQQVNHRLSLPMQRDITILNDRQSAVESKSKRTLSPLNEIEQESRHSKRPKSFDDDDDEDEEEIFELIDHRRHRSKSSQISNTSISSQGNEQRKPTVRKPTARKLSSSQHQPSASQPILIEPLPIDLEVISSSTNDILPTSIIQSDEHEVSGRSIPTPIILSPIELPIDSHRESNKQISMEIRTPQQLFDNPIDNSSPCSNRTTIGRRFSTTSSASLFFDTPNSSLSRTTTTMNTTSTPQPVLKINHETQISRPLYADMINQLISQMNLSITNHENAIDYNPNELATKFFEQSSLFFTNDKHRSIQFIPKKQFLNFGRYEIEILFPTHENQNSTIHICDICLKYFPTSAMSFQRHTAKCLCTQPPGKLIFKQKNLVVFQINGIHLNLKQRIYLKSLFHLTRLFVDLNKTIDDSKIDRFDYYILCRQDPILFSTQPIIYRFIGYFSQQHSQLNPKFINNLSRLFILPPFINHYQYEQLLISFSYSLIRLNHSMTNVCTSPVRPLDHRTLVTFRTYWLDVLSKYLLDHSDSSSSFSLDDFTRQTSIHPRDILSSLYSAGFLVRHFQDNSSVYLHNNAYRSMTCLNRNQFLYLDTNDEKKMMIDKTNSEKISSANFEEIILD